MICMSRMETNINHLLHNNFMKTYVCKICGTSFDYRTTRGTQVCSKTCHKKLLSEMRMGEKNPRFNNGWRQYHRIKKHIKFCENCGRNYNLEVHHLDGNNKNNKPENLIKVCRRCHMLLDDRMLNLNNHNSGTGVNSKEGIKYELRLIKEVRNHDDM